MHEIRIRLIYALINFRIVLHSKSKITYSFGHREVGLSEEPVQQEKEAAGSGGGGVWEMVVAGGRKQRRRKNCRGRSRMASMEEEDDDDDETEGAEDDDNCGGGGGNERQREHPFIVTEPGEVARGKKNGLDYLFHLYEQCREFLIQVQNIAKERGEKCPTKVYLILSYFNLY